MQDALIVSIFTAVIGVIVGALAGSAHKQLKAWLAYPEPLHNQANRVQLRSDTDPNGEPEITVANNGKRPITKVRIYVIEKSRKPPVKCG